MRRKKSRVSVWRRLHRTLGASAAAFILFMAFSGMAINHAQNLGLDAHHVSQPLLLRWYGFEQPREIRSYAAGGHWLSFAGSRAYFDGNYVSALSNGVGVVFTGEMIVAAGTGELLLLDLQGGLIEKLPWDRPEAELVDSIGLLENGEIVVKSAGKLWMTDAQLLQWQPAAEGTLNPAWSKPSNEPEVIRQAVVQQYQGAGMSMERLILDLHSGRIFGPVGIFIYDLLAVIVGFLAISGVVFWFRGRRNGNKRYPKF
jgi:hypothetical protein